jgi:hypothetical protein
MIWTRLPIWPQAFTLLTAPPDDYRSNFDKAHAALAFGEVAG